MNYLDLFKFDSDMFYKEYDTEERERERNFNS